MRPCYVCGKEFQAIQPQPPWGYVPPVVIPICQGCEWVRRAR